MVPANVQRDGHEILELYEESAFYYDIIYSYKNYEKESEKLRRIIQRYKKSKKNFLVDVACGTGNHITYLKKHHKVQGLDNNPRMLRQARKKYPDVSFHLGDMIRFNLRTAFDVVTCLQLHRTCQNESSPTSGRAQYG